MDIKGIVNELTTNLYNQLQDYCIQHVIDFGLGGLESHSIYNHSMRRLEYFLEEDFFAALGKKCVESSIAPKMMVRYRPTHNKCAFPPVSLYEIIEKNVY